MVLAKRLTPESPAWLASGPFLPANCDAWPAVGRDVKPIADMLCGRLDEHLHLPHCLVVGRILIYDDVAGDGHRRSKVAQGVAVDGDAILFTRLEVGRSVAARLMRARAMAATGFGQPISRSAVGHRRGLMAACHEHLMEHVAGHPSHFSVLAMLLRMRKVMWALPFR
jgi:hypothetical protein